MDNRTRGSLMNFCSLLGFFFIGSGLSGSILWRIMFYDGRVYAIQAIAGFLLLWAGIRLRRKWKSPAREILDIMEYVERQNFGGLTLNEYEELKACEAKLADND